tara:strand:- start:152 stop:475 length:324 start_codon:yes stop_codon:yes gene_type:complete
MTVYQKLGGYIFIAAPGSATLAPADLDGGFTGNTNISYVKVTNPGTAVIELSWNTTGTLVGSVEPTVVAAGTTEFIQVAAANNRGPVYFYVDGTSVTVYITPIAIVG